MSSPFALRNLAIFLLIVHNNVSATPVRECSNIAEPLSVMINDCVEPPCELPQRSTAVMDIIFRVPKAYRSLSPNVLATVAGTTTPYPLDANGCNKLQNGYCPIVVGEVLHYRFTMPISFIFPQVSVELEFKLLGDNDTKEPMTCFKVSARVVAPRNPFQEISS